MDTTRRPGPVPGRRTRMIILAAWLGLGIIESAKAMVMQRLNGFDLTWSQALANNMPYWFFWALLTPLIFVLLRAFPLDRERRALSAAVHALASVAVPLLHLLATGIVFYFTTTRNVAANIPNWQAQVKFLVAGYIVVEILIYWAVLGAFYVLEFYRRYRDEERSAARLAVRAAQLESSMSEARLTALRMELNPHFLFNTLNAVAGLVRRRENDAAVGMLARLGELLRITLDRGGVHEITLKEELSLLEHYLEIEQLRFHDRLTVEVDVPEELHPALVPTLMLQPLVENAMRHGIAQRPGPVRLCIRAQRVGSELILTVRDTGAGLVNGHEPREGIGLSNTRARLDQLYGTTARCTIEAASGGGVVSTITLPLHHREEASHELQHA